MLWWKVCHIFRKGRPTNFKLCKQMDHEDPYHKQARWSPRSKVMVARSRGLSGRCWLIIRERKVPETPKIVGKLPTPRTITRTRFEVKRSEIKVTRLINAETENVSPTNFKPGRRLERALSTAMASYKCLWSWVIERGREHTVSAALGGHVTCIVTVANMCQNCQVVLWRILCLTDFMMRL